jgi:hypothetical protein
MISYTLGAGDARPHPTQRGGDGWFIARAGCKMFCVGFADILAPLRKKTICEFGEANY